MILKAGIQVTCHLIGVNADVRVSVVSAGPPDEPASVWAVTVDEPRKYVLVKKAPKFDELAPAYMGMLLSAPVSDDTWV